MGLLVFVGLVAAIARGIFPTDLMERGEPGRQLLFERLGQVDPFRLERPGLVRRFDGKYADHPLVTWLHILPGAAFLVLAPLQFSSTIRRRHVRLHRWSGRFLVTIGVVAGLTGLYFGLFAPFAGMAEASVIAVVGGFLLVALARAVAAIRSGRRELHREWMIRAFALMLGPSMVRVAGAGLDVTLTPAGVPSPTLFVASLWAGWIVTLGVAEAWIQLTRVEPPGARLSPEATPTGPGARLTPGP